ncbi:zinc finger and BTB domain-containing protein 26-like [Boleophthalmus pectinirostris]|uniref:zinc finger and BTB domain-containing protein 26-like n=1 Tax=Boleophthalmus pectinirostris TaxID=150288 RepID=UPI000A1C72A1|nr:zinc finger and BTB domain-containing protein 26-like [Boleophthalmus pectinirostris]XP_055009471.1 zinc finger and BTB domain-containing protein 26-like [Boleophthalmus pectinirostris]XP_055009472.1 zinc finger and BTB domain-containing protein 26-like [Boleophthalmus pectinirostris]XP_055009473.1 zinc finger and BTB domain-containing protein 26-like [Boleophthalmus pectinirostris]
MSDQPDPLRFTLPSHPDTVLSRMDILREERHFCDITLLLGGPLGATEPFCFHGHKVVLAAASDFLRDQFLLHDGQTELAVGVVTNVEVGRRLLLSCYTGLLEVPRCELVTYLTTASALQINSVVEQCAQAISLYFTLEKTSKAKEIPQTQDLNNTVNQPENTDPQQQLREDDNENRNKVLESESNITTNDNSKHSDLSRYVENGPLECKQHSAENCFTTSTVRDKTCPDNEGRLLESLQEKDGKSDLNKNIEQPLAELEIAISKDMPKQSTVKSCIVGDTVDNLLSKSYLCQQCDHVFQHMDNYVQHIKDYHYYQCLVCEKSFPQKTALSRHVQVHGPVKPYRCPLCHSTFPDKTSLQYHINVHTGYKPHKCNYCTGQFNLKPGLRRHLKDTHGKCNLENVLEEGNC